MTAESAPPCQHEWLPETRYRIRRCKHCGAHHFADALARLRWRAHVHVGDPSGGKQPWGSCYGSYESCGEHHAHDDRCGSRNVVCGRPEDRDAVALVERIDAMLAQFDPVSDQNVATETHPPNTALGRRVGVEPGPRR